ncbi:MAG: baseplate assembly protein [Sphingomonadales bacterium RIFCSPHIGHO2_01_FULL_65_20]|nr:MAG: baseplate assembly protein [Sphingomonadales bacterium RIFCSPHIGHO2_01_FULL_65_20]
MPISSIATSPAIDLSALPPPAIVAQPDFEARVAAKIARLLVTLPAFDALVESDPAIKLLEADSYDEMLLAQACNDAARQMLIAFATGANLDHLGALYGVTRLVITPADLETGAPAVLESDEELRARILLAPHSFSVAGPEMAYVYHAMAASGDVLHASATSPTPGQVVVSVLSRTGDGTAPPATLDAVEAVLTDDHVRPLTDEVIVQSADIVDFNIVAQLWLYAGPDPDLILATAQASLAALLAKAKRLGRDIPRSAIIAALHVAGVQRVVLPSPAADIVITSLQAGNAAAIAVTIAGYDE